MKSTNPWIALQYLFAYTVPLSAFISLALGGTWVWITLVYVFALIPMVERIIPLRPVEHDFDSKKWLFDLILIPSVLVLPGLHYLGLNWIHQEGQVWWEWMGAALAVGICNGVIGINVAHELGHRKSVYYRLLAHLLLLCTTYLHFYVEHNYGHHKRVATPEDPASSRKNETVYRFWWRSMSGGYLSAWQLSGQWVKSGLMPLNVMWIYHGLSLALMASLFYFLGGEAVLFFAACSIIGILMLESVNYIEHYGLNRKKVSANMYERVRPSDSWDSDHLLGRLALFELSRHADHHTHAHKPYCDLNIQAESPKMPVGYPESILRSLIPVVWFRDRNPLVDEHNRNLNRDDE